MVVSHLDLAIGCYASRLSTLEKAIPSLSDELILDVLLARDEIHTSLSQVATRHLPEKPEQLMGIWALLKRFLIRRVVKDRNTDFKASVGQFGPDALHPPVAPANVSTVKTLFQLDSRLKAQGGVIARSVNLAEWRASLNPPKEAWWWFFEPLSPSTNRFDWLWSALAVVFLTISLSLLLDTSSRFLSGGLDAWATFAVVGQSVLAMLAAGGTLTTVGRESFDRILEAIHISRRWRQEIRLGSAILLLLALLVVRSYLPVTAMLYNNRGYASYRNGQFTSAEFDFRRALRLAPDYVEPHYNLGLLYEDLQYYDQAKTEYRIAIAGKLSTAYNNLGRLYVREENYAEAVPLLLAGLDLSQDENVLYDLHKNLGWARLGQKRPAEADVELRAAIDLAGEQASAHCLLAQLLEAQNDVAGSLAEWEICLKYAEGRNADEDSWIDMARQRLGGSE